MRITEVESTDLFTGSTARPLQVVRVGVAATEAGEAGATVSVRLAGGSVETPTPSEVILSSNESMWAAKRSGRPAPLLSYAGQCMGCVVARGGGRHIRHLDPTEAG